VTLLNFAHPLPPYLVRAVEELAGRGVERVIDIPCHFDHGRPFAPQARDLVESAGLTQEEWQTQPLLVNLPSLSVIAALVLAEIHGRRGHFPAVLRLRPVDGAVVRTFEAAEVLSLQDVRDQARRPAG
jgi:hypothetical protein